MINKLLTRLSHTFHLDFHYLAKGGFWLTLGQFASSLAAFILSLAYANLLPKAVYGTYKYILSIASILTITTLSGMNTSLTQAVARGKSQLLLSTLETRLKWGSLGGLASLAVSGYYLWQNNAELALAFLIVAIFLPFMDSFNLYDAFYYGRKDFGTSTRYFLINQTVAVITMLLMVYFFPTHLSLILLGYFAPWTLMRAWFTRLTIKRYQENKNQPDLEVINYGRHLTFLGVLGTIANYIDRIIIFQFIGAQSLATYSVAIAPLDQIKSLANRGLSTLALPKYSLKDREDVKKHVTRWVNILTAVLALIVVAYILAAPWLFKILFPKYAEAVWYTRLYALGLLPMGFSLAQTALSSQAAKKELYHTNIDVSIFQIVTLLLFGYLWSINGIIIAIILSRFFSLFLSNYLVRKF